MFHRKTRRFRRRPNGRNGMHHNSSVRTGTNQFSNVQVRSNFRSQLSAEKLLEKYSAVAIEAMSAGDITLGENYLQHADHFMRIIEDKNKNRDQNKVDIIDKTVSGDKPSLEDNNIKQEDVIKNKE